MWKPQVRYLTCADPENFLDGGGGVTFRPGWVQLHTSGVVINLSKWVDHGIDSSRGGVTWGNFGTGVRPSILKPTPIIYLAFEKYGLFIYLIVHNVEVFICCLLIL